MTSFRQLIRLLFFTLILCVSFINLPARAEEQLLLLAGNNSLADTAMPQTTDTWQIEYVSALNQYFSYGLDHANLGEFNHGISHHPDYDGASLWAHTDFFDNRLRLSAGAGLLFYYDTVGSSYGRESTNVHGWGSNYALTATWHTNSPWLFQARAGYARVDGLDAKSIMFGAGYEFDGNSTPSANGTPNQSSVSTFGENHNDVTVYGGQGLINQPYSVRTQSVALEYRRDINPYLQWTVGYLDEGNSPLADRRGIMGELWLNKSLFDKRLSLSAGIGPYIAIDRSQNTFVTTMRSIAAAFEVTPSISVRTTWERIITNYNRDSDVFLIGAGYKF